MRAVLDDGASRSTVVELSFDCLTSFSEHQYSVDTKGRYHRSSIYFKKDKIVQNSSDNVHRVVLMERGVYGA